MDDSVTEKQAFQAYMDLITKALTQSMTPKEFRELIDKPINLMHIGAYYDKLLAGLIKGGGDEVFAEGMAMVHTKSWWRSRLSPEELEALKVNYYNLYGTILINTTRNYPRRGFGYQEWLVNGVPPWGVADVLRHLYSPECVRAIMSEIDPEGGFYYLVKIDWPDPRVDQWTVRVRKLTPERYAAEYEKQMAAKTALKASK